MSQLTFDYQLMDDNGISQAENIPLLIPVGGSFKHEFGQYVVVDHVKQADGRLLPICERINKEGLK